MTDIKIYEPLWGSWYIDEQLGEGSFGKVYRVHKEEFGRKYEAAVKIISIPQSEADILQAKSEGLNDESARSYFQAFVTDIIQEIDLMSAFRGNSNVVSLEDHTVIEHKGKIGWDILIRMELLSTLSSYVTQKPMTQAEVVKLGIHICRALELCAKHNTIHRDIKPDNIFISQYGDYKLGDFGIARQIERTMSGLSKKGTYQYMAPEVFKGNEYGASVDTYSLGIVMYRFLNKNRAPFLPAFPEPITPRDRDDALLRRMNGENIPSIPGINDELNSIVLKACAYDRHERFKNASEMKTALEFLANSLSDLSLPIIVTSEPKNSGADDDDETFEDETTTRTETINDFDSETDEGTRIVFPRHEEVVDEEPDVPEKKEVKVPEKIMKALACFSSVCLGILALLTFFSNTSKDIFTFLPIYILCISQAVLKFRNKIINNSFIVFLASYLLYGVLIDFQFFDYYLLSFTLGVLSLEASKDKRAGIVYCVAMIICSIIFGLLVVHVSRTTHYVYVIGAIAIPLMTLINSPTSLLLMSTEDAETLSRKNVIGIALLISSQLCMLIVFAIYVFRNSQLLYYVINANFPGFSPERFSWWSYGRFIGLILQFCAFSSLLAEAAASITPEKFLNAMNSQNRRKVILSTLTIISVITLIIVIFMSI